MRAVALILLVAPLSSGFRASSASALLSAEELGRANPLARFGDDGDIASLSAAEFAGYHRLRVDEFAGPAAPTTPPGLPDAIDWRTAAGNPHGRVLVTAIKNQGRCGSCWACPVHTESARVREIVWRAAAQIEWCAKIHLVYTCRPFRRREGSRVRGRWLAGR